MNRHGSRLAERYIASGAGAWVLLLASYLFLLAAVAGYMTEERFPALGLSQEGHIALMGFFTLFFALALMFIKEGVRTLSVMIAVLLGGIILIVVDGTVQGGSHPNVGIPHYIMHAVLPVLLGLSAWRCLRALPYKRAQGG